MVVVVVLDVVLIEQLHSGGHSGFSQLQINLVVVEVVSLLEDIFEVEVVTNVEVVVVTASEP